MLAMAASRIVAPSSKLASARWWNTTTLAEQSEVAGAGRGGSVRGGGLAARTPGPDPGESGGAPFATGWHGALRPFLGLFQGRDVPVANRGSNRDGKRGMLQVNYGLLTDPRGCPVAISVHEGNT